MEPYGLDLRARIVEAHKNREGSVRELAERFAVAPNTVQNYLTLYRTTGSVAPRPHGGGVPPKIDERSLEQVGMLVEKMSDATVNELADEFSRRHHIAVGRSTMDRALGRLNVTRKKNAACDRAGHGEVRREASRLRRAGREGPPGAPRFRR